MGIPHFDERNATVKAKQNVRLLAMIAVYSILVGVWAFSFDSNWLWGQIPAQSKFLVDPFWPPPLPNDWMMGSVGGVCVDSHDHVFIMNRVTAGDRDAFNEREMETRKPVPPVVEVDEAGKVVNSWGDPKVVPNRIHGCYFDYQDNAWIPGSGEDATIQKYSHDGKLLLTIGVKGKFDSADGTGKGPGLNSSHTLLNRPTTTAVDPANGDVYVSDGYGNRRIVVFDRNGNYLRQFGRQATKEEAAADMGGVFLGVVHHVALSNDGLLYVSDRDGKRLQVFDKMGNFKKNIFLKRVRADLPGRGQPWWTLLSPDKAQKYLYVGDGVDEIVWTIDRQTGETLSGFGRVGRMAGEFFLHEMAINSKGDIFIGEPDRGRRVQKFKAMAN